MSKTMYVNSKNQPIELTEAQQQQEPIVTLPYSVKIEQTAKGGRVSVHVYNVDLNTATREAVEGYANARKQLAGQGLKVAPEE
jgi:hypothetical protein